MKSQVLISTIEEQALLARRVMERARVRMTHAESALHHDDARLNARVGLRLLQLARRLIGDLERSMDLWQRAA